MLDLSLDAIFHVYFDYLYISELSFEIDFIKYVVISVRFFLVVNLYTRCVCVVFSFSLRVLQSLTLDDLMNIVFQKPKERFVLRDWELWISLSPRLNEMVITLYKKTTVMSNKSRCYCCYLSSMSVANKGGNSTDWGCFRTLPLFHKLVVFWRH